ncbi:MAG: hypothetical protein RIT25_1331 [Planctomycetota bacterium]|jgi:hypothetical protein
MESLALVLMVIFGFVLARSWLDQRDKHVQARMRLLEQAVASGVTDPGQLDQLGRQAVPARVPPLSAFSLWVGWVCMFVGAGLVLAAQSTGDLEMQTGGLITGAVGLAMATFPFALQELEMRRARA